jgi:hypothetical protein
MPEAADYGMSPLPISPKGKGKAEDENRESTEQERNFGNPGNQ